MRLRILILLISTVTMFGCDYIDDTFNSIDTSKIIAKPSDIASTIKWEGYFDTTNATAKIEKVLFECVKNYNLNDTTKSKRREFDIALTAVISFNITNIYTDTFQSSIIFEA